MREYGSNIILPSLDNLFSSEQERQDAKLEKIQILPLSELHPFEGHPFQVRDDEEMDKMVDSVKEYGVMTPAIVRPRRDGEYEIVAGHRRCHASRRAGVDTMPCIVRDMDDDTAIILMVDSNCQREHILPSEKAKAYQMKLEAIKRQGRRSDLTSGQVGPKLEERRSNQIVAEKAGESVKQVQRFIRLNKLTPDLMQLVDDGRLKTTPAVELSYLTPEEQEEFLSYMEEEGCTPSLSQAQKLKAASKESVLTKDKIHGIMSARSPSVKPREPQLTIAVSKVERYFPKGFSSEQMESTILKLLENYYRKRQDYER
ncbi:MAG: ParB/RepB/Spo0J family partition protein [Oscillospiraceae bacterium]|nr:MAG: ParB/RepB/Spo0J family partition protein [Oscillospiraceae bacterium]